MNFLATFWDGLHFPYFLRGQGVSDADFLWFKSLKTAPKVIIKIFYNVLKILVPDISSESSRKQDFRGSIFDLLSTRYHGIFWD